MDKLKFTVLIRFALFAVDVIPSDHNLSFPQVGENIILHQQGSWIPRFVSLKLLRPFSLLDIAQRDGDHKMGRLKNSNYCKRLLAIFRQAIPKRQFHGEAFMVRLSS